MRERYGVEPEQVPDLIALRGDPSDKLPGARGIGPKKAAELLTQYATLEDVLAAGRFASEAEDLRLFRRIAQMDASAPLPPLKPLTPTWAEASSFVRELGLQQLADRLASVRVNDWLSARADALAKRSGVDRAALELSDAEIDGLLELAGPRRTRQRRAHECAAPLLPRRPRTVRRRIARRARRDRPIDVLTHPALAHLHRTGEHPEREERLVVLLEHFTDWSEGRAATEDELLLCHTAEHLARIRALEGRTWLDGDTVGSDSTFEAGSLAAGTAIEAALRGGFALVRPPGHHALRERAMGFCIFNNIAIAARAAQRELGLERVAIVDYDVHHGNGTDAIFRDDDSVLFVSLHQWPFYPGTGGPDDQAADDPEHPARRGLGRRRVPRRVRAARRACGRGVRARARARLRRVRRPPRRPAGRDARDRRRLPRALEALRRARATRRGGARGRLRARDPAAGSSRRRSTASRTSKRKGPFGALSLPHHPPNLFLEGKLA